MKYILAVCATVLMMVSVHADDNEDRQRLANNAEDLTKALAAMETRYLDGVKTNELSESLKGAKQELSVFREKAAWLHRKAHIKASVGVNDALLWRWGTAKELCNALSEETRSAKPAFRVDLEPDAGGDTALFVRRSTALFLQLPTDVHLQMKTSPRKYGLFQDNFKALKDSKRGKNILASSVQWRNRVQVLLFYFWILHKGADWVHEWPADITHPAYFAQRQAEEVFKLAGCAFYVPKNSAIALDYEQRIKILTEAAAEMTSFCQRNSKLRKWCKPVQDTEKLGVIWRRWNGRMDYLFYWSDIEVDAVDDLKPRLDEQMPLTAKYAAELRKEKEAREKAAKVAKFSKKKKADKPKDGEEAPPEEKAPAPVKKAVAPPPPKDMFSRDIYEYNLEIFTQAEEWRKDVREVELFKADMIAFARILARFREVATALHEQFPEGLVKEGRRGSTWRTIPPGRK